MKELLGLLLFGALAGLLWLGLRFICDLVEQSRKDGHK